MNERMKQLKQQAESLVRQEHGYAENTLLPQEWVDAKFAELIVRECAQLARDTNLEDVEGGDNDVLRAAKQQILEHFGVEE